MYHKPTLVRAVSSVIVDASPDGGGSGGLTGAGEEDRAAENALPSASVEAFEELLVPDLDLEDERSFFLLDLSFFSF